MHDPYNAFVDLDPDAKSGPGPLSDLRIGIKANIAVKGLPWTGGMGTRRGIIADKDAVVVAQLRAAGAAILGTLNMHEAALGATTDNPFFGTTMNPHRAGFTPGGSSGGSGAAVAAGLCDVALGTDTLGSVRIPAAYCGVYGLKPTNGTVSDEGLVSLARDFDCIGPLARDLDVLERVWAVLPPLPFRGGVGGGDVTTRAAPFGLPHPNPSPEGEGLNALYTLANLGNMSVQPAIRKAYDRAVVLLSITPTPITLPDDMTQIRLAALARCGRELIAHYGDARTGDGVSPQMQSLLRAVENIPLNPAVLTRTRETLHDALGTNGILIMPTAPQAAFAHGRAPDNQAGFTGLANIAGLPALAIPAGLDDDRLPVSVQLVGPAGSETTLIALARTLETEFGGSIPPQQET